MYLFISKSFLGSDIVYFGEIKRWRLYVLTFSEMEFPKKNMDSDVTWPL